MYTFLQALVGWWIRLEAMAIKVMRSNPTHLLSFYFPTRTKILLIGGVDVCPLMSRRCRLRSCPDWLISLVVKKIFTAIFSSKVGISYIRVLMGIPIHLLKLRQKMIFRRKSANVALKLSDIKIRSTGKKNWPSFLQ